MLCVSTTKTGICIFISLLIMLNRVFEDRSDDLAFSNTSICNVNMYLVARVLNICVIKCFKV